MTDLLICIGAGLLMIGSILLFLAVLFISMWCIEDNDKPTWVGWLIVGVVLLAFVVLVGCAIAFDLGWIADCPWCEAKP